MAETYVSPTDMTDEERARLATVPLPAQEIAVLPAIRDHSITLKEKIAQAGLPY